MVSVNTQDVIGRIFLLLLDRKATRKELDGIEKVAPDARDLGWVEGYIKALPEHSLRSTAIAQRGFGDVVRRGVALRAMYREHLGRDPDPTGWVTYMYQVPSSIEKLPALIAGSSEASARARNRYAKIVVLPGWNNQ